MCPGFSSEIALCYLLSSPDQILQVRDAEAHESLSTARNTVAATYKGNQAFVWLFKVNALILCSCFWQAASFCEFYSLLKLYIFC